MLNQSDTSDDFKTYFIIYKIYRSLCISWIVEVTLRLAGELSQKYAQIALVFAPTSWKLMIFPRRYSHSTTSPGIPGLPQDFVTVHGTDVSGSITHSRGSCMLNTDRDDKYAKNNTAIGSTFELKCIMCTWWPEKSHKGSTPKWHELSERCWMRNLCRVAGNTVDSIRHSSNVELL